MVTDRYTELNLFLRGGTCAEPSRSQADTCFTLVRTWVDPEDTSYLTGFPRAGSDSR
jgi:hypothetical protein